VLDIRLAVNPWIPLQQRMQHTSNTRTSSLSRSLRSLLLQQQQPVRSSQGVFKLDEQLQGRIDYAAAGGPLSAAELASAVVISHSLPGAPLAGVLADVARFLQEQPSEVRRLQETWIIAGNWQTAAGVFACACIVYVQFHECASRSCSPTNMPSSSASDGLLCSCYIPLQVVVMLVKGDTVDVNVAGIQRMSPQAWAAAADIFRRELAGVQLLQQQQVRWWCGVVCSGAACTGRVAASCMGLNSVV
jgi:hypothetical protein